MPLYEYECQKCHKKTEYIQKFSDAPKKKCEHCGGKLEKLISAAGFVLKGGGWYKDLYASQKPGSSSSDSESSSPKPVETKSESKPAESKPVETKSKKDKK
jgi:putative FmdB family regulatory protein